MNNGLDKKLKKILGETILDEQMVVLEQLREARYDEDIAEELSQKAVTIRKLLNELHDKDLVQYVRTKNPKTGWYTYVWDRRDDKILEYSRNYLGNKISEIEDKLFYEQNNLMFVCACKDRYVPMTYAMENNFHCGECNNYFTEFDNSNVIEGLEKSKKKLNADIKKINKIEIQKEN